MRLPNTLKLSFLVGSLVFATQAFSQTDTMSTTTSSDKVVASTPQEDSVITHSLKKMINDSKTLSKLNVHVSTTKGVVMLSGTVDSETQASDLVVLADSIIGVSDVDTSKLTVKDGKQPLADAMTTAKIKGILIREKLFGEKDIAAINTSVETKDGVVYLSGVVDNQDQINNAIDIIKKSVPEVKKVEYSVTKAAS